MRTPHLAPDADMMLTHVQRLFGEQTDGSIELAYTSPESKNVARAEYFALDQLEKLADRASELNSQDGVNVYIGPGLRHPDSAPFGRSSDKDFYAAQTFWADADDEGVAEAVDARSGRARPTFAVVTGRMPHERAQFYWVQEQPITDPEALKRQNAAIAGRAQEVGCGESRHQVTRTGAPAAWRSVRETIPEP